MKKLILAGLLASLCFGQQANQVLRNPFNGNLKTNGLTITGSYVCTAPSCTVEPLGYNFTPQALSVAVTASTPSTITLTPCPLGVAGTNTKHYLYITGNGSPEAVLITGGTCTSGGFTGTITFTPANSHTTAATIGSATVGITEAEYALLSYSPGGGKVHMPAGNYQLLAAIPFKPHIVWQGDGVGTTLLPASCSATVFDANLPVHGSDDLHLHEDSIVFSDFLIDGVNCLPGINSAYGIKELNSPTSAEYASIAGVLINNVQISNIYNAIYMDRATRIKVLHSGTWYNSRIVFTDSSGMNFPNNGITFDDWEYNYHPISTDNAIATMTDAPVLCVLCEVFYVTNSHLSGRPIMGASGVELMGGEDAQITNTEFEQFYAGISLNPVTLTDVGTIYPGFTIISHNSFDQIDGYGVITATAFSSTGMLAAKHITITDNLFTNQTTLLINNGSAVSLGNFTKDVTLSGNIFDALVASGQSMLGIGSFVDTVFIDPSNIFDNDFSLGSGSIGTAVIVTGTATNITGLNTVGPCGRFTTCVNDGGGSVASANTMTLPTGRRFVTVTGTTNINIITPQLPGTSVTLLIPGILTVVDHFGSGGNVFLGSNFVTNGTQYNTLTLYCDGVNWSQLSRSAN